MKGKKQNKKEKRNAVLCSIALQYSCASLHCFVAVLLFLYQKILFFHCDCITAVDCCDAMRGRYAILITCG